MKEFSRRRIDFNIDDNVNTKSCSDDV